MVSQPNGPTEQALARSTRSARRAPPPVAPTTVESAKEAPKEETRTSARGKAAADKNASSLMPPPLPASTSAVTFGEWVAPAMALTCVSRSYVNAVATPNLQVQRRLRSTAL